jgi:hypothetical protein
MRRLLLRSLGSSLPRSGATTSGLVPPGTCGTPGSRRRPDPRETGEGTEPAGRTTRPSTALRSAGFGPPALARPRTESNTMNPPQHPANRRRDGRRCLPVAPGPRRRQDPVRSAFVPTALESPCGSSKTGCGQSGSSSSKTFSSTEGTRTACAVALSHHPPCAWRAGSLQHVESWRDEIDLLRCFEILDGAEEMTCDVSALDETRPARRLGSRHSGDQRELAWATSRLSRDSGCA